MAYAAMISLKHHIECLVNPNISWQITRSAYVKLKRLQGFLQVLDGNKNNQSFDISAIKALDAEIRKAVWKLEDAFESYALSNIDCSQMQTPLVDNKGMEQEIRSFNGTAEILGREFENLLGRPLDVEAEDEDEMSDFGGNKSTTMGLSKDQFKEITTELVDGEPGLKVISLVGMAGIGKTHFAREIVQHPKIAKYFNCIVWMRVGQKGRVKNVIVDIISEIARQPKDKYLNESMYVLGMVLRDVLDGRKWLIVLDDVWNEVVCHDIICRLGEAGAGRVLLTTRLGHVNDYKKSKIHQMRFLSNEESWNLLWRNVFAGEPSYPPQLEKAGRKIAANCEGLPLLILVVVHLLCGAEKTEEYWQKVADKNTSTFDDAYDKISKVLFSSYEYLPENLKTFFLYMGVFPQACEVPHSKLINLLTVEDFLESNLEYKIVESLEKLVSNSLVIVCKQDYYRKRMKSCKLHSAYWYLCIKEARKSKFLHVMNKHSDGAQEYIESQRRLSVQNSILFGIKEVHDSMAEASSARSLLCTGKDQQYPVPICFNLMLLRVLDALSIRLYEFPEEVMKLLLLRYLALTYNGKLPSSISSLRHLQFLIVYQNHNIKVLSDSHTTCLPKEIWDMRQLKHLRIRGYNISDPRYGALPLPNLETLYVNAHSCTEDVFAKLPYLLKLRISIELEPGTAATPSCLEHIGLLGQLQSLRCVVVNPCLRLEAVPPPGDLSNLPRSLKKLSLSGLGYHWDYMTAISSLPNLKVLKLRCSAFQGLEWCVRYGDFLSLEFLLLEDINLVDWSIFRSHCLRQLQRLTLRHCFKLKAMPYDFKYDEYLKTVEVEVIDCSPSVVASAKEINRWNSTCPRQIVIDSSWSL